MNNILISVVIPTKNRYSTLLPLIEQIQNICVGNDLLEVIVQDNSDCNDDAVEFFKNIKAENIRYYYEKKWLSVCDNSDLAILHSSGEYVLFIGDDDAFTSSIVEVAKYLEKNKIDACGCDYALYRWPAAFIEGGRSLEYNSLGKIVRFPNVKKALRNSLRGGIQTKKDLPCVYHGIVKRTVLDLIYKKTGSFFPGPSPDMANCFALSTIVEKYIVTSVPFVIDGYSKASTGHLTETKKHVGKLEEMSFLNKKYVQNWIDCIPRVWLPNTIWPESGLEALKSMDRLDLLKKFNPLAMYIKIGKFYPEFKDLCNQYIHNYGRLEYLLNFFLVCYRYVFNYCVSYFEKKRGRISLKIDNPISIEQAIKTTSGIIESNKMLDFFLV